MQKSRIIAAENRLRFPAGITFEDGVIHGQPLRRAAARLVTEKVRAVRCVAAGVTYPVWAGCAAGQVTDSPTTNSCLPIRGLFEAGKPSFPLWQIRTRCAIRLIAEVLPPFLAGEVAGETLTNFGD